MISQFYRIVLTVSCHSLSFILTASGIQAQCRFMSFFLLLRFLYVMGRTATREGGPHYLRAQHWIDFCFALSIFSDCVESVCFHAVFFFRVLLLGWLVSIQWNKDKIVPYDLLSLQISNYSECLHIVLSTVAEQPADKS